MQISLSFSTLQHLPSLPAQPTSSPSKAVIADDDNKETPNNTPVTVNVTLNDIYPPNANLTVTISNQASNGTCEVVPVNQVLYTPNALFTGQDNCEYTLCDSVSNSCGTATVFVDVGDPSPPVAIDDKDVTLFNEAITVDVLVNDTQAEGLALDVRNITTNATNGTCVKDGDGVKYTPNAGFVGTDSCVYTACVTGSSKACDTATLTITVWAAPTSNPTQSPSKEVSFCCCYVSESSLSLEYSRIRPYHHSRHLKHALTLFISPLLTLTSDSSHSHLRLQANLLQGAQAKCRLYRRHHRFVSFLFVLWLRDS